MVLYTSMLVNGGSTLLIWFSRLHARSLASFVCSRCQASAAGSHVETYEGHPNYGLDYTILFSFPIPYPPLLVFYSRTRTSILLKRSLYNEYTLSKIL